MSRTTVRIPAPLRAFTGGADEVAATGATVGEVLRDLAAHHQGLGRHLLDDGGELRTFVNVFVGDAEVRALDGLASPVTDGAVLHIVPAVAGGGA